MITNLLEQNLYIISVEYSYSWKLVTENMDRVCQKEMGEDLQNKTSYLFMLSNPSIKEGS